MPEHKRPTPALTREPGWSVGHCLEPGVVSQGRTVEEAQRNLREAAELYLESFGAEDDPESDAELLLYPLGGVARRRPRGGTRITASPEGRNRGQGRVSRLAARAPAAGPGQPRRLGGAG